MTEDNEREIDRLCNEIAKMTNLDPGNLKRSVAKRCEEVGFEEVRELIDGLIKADRIRYVRFPNSYIQTCLRNLKPKPKPAESVPVEERLDEANESQESILESEERHYIDTVNLFERYGLKFKAPRKLEELTPKPYFLVAGLPLSEKEKVELMRKYLQYPFLTVRQMAKEEGISMHEVCERLGLNYANLIL